MPDLFMDLYLLMEKQVSTVHNLTAAVERQIAALRQDSLNDLNNALEEIGAHGVELARLEDTRLGVQIELEKVLGLPEGAGLKDLLPYAPPDLQGPMTALRDRLKDALRALQEANSIAQAMSACALQLHTTMLRLLTNRGGETYGAGGKIDGGGAAGSLDRSV
ncbi:MAG: flagellar export chaperone FlgN [Thermoanaerobacterales bacterium]|nr:flagellar export chaperone FlgN [Bacillota bacterium]MDI6906164.1 flagellar export chaperone FlgN [Thermoanaerobacterales bacterium]